MPPAPLVDLTGIGLYFFGGASLQRRDWLREPLQRRRVALWALGLVVASPLLPAGLTAALAFRSRHLVEEWALRLEPRLSPAATWA